VAVVADAAVAGIDAANLADLLADLVGVEGVGDEVVLERRSEILVDGGEQFGTQAGLETEGLGAGERAALPVEELVHLEDPDVGPAEALAVGDRGEQGILGDGADRQDQAGGLAALVVEADLLGDSAGEVGEQGRDIGKEAEGEAGRSLQLLERHLHEAFELVLAPHESDGTIGDLAIEGLGDWVTG